MDIDRTYNNRKHTVTGKSFYIIGLLFFSLFIFTGIGSADQGRHPTEPPVILSHTPGVDAVQIPLNGAISVVWDRPMQPESDFAVTGPEGFLAGSFVYDSKTFTVTFLPDQDLIPETRYGVLVAGQVDIEGQVQGEAYQWNFNTITPTSVSIVSFSEADEGLGQSWWWLSWPLLMAVVSILSLAGFMAIWGRRRLIFPVKSAADYTNSGD